MKALFLIFLIAVAALPAHGQKPQPAVDELLRRIRAEIPKGWRASYSEESSWLEISRDEAVSYVLDAPDGRGGVEPDRRKFSLAFRVVPTISQAEHHRLSVENAEIRMKLHAMYEDLVKKRMNQKFDSFSPRTDSEKAALAQYEALKNSLHNLPDFYFRDISLN